MQECGNAGMQNAECKMNLETGTWNLELEIKNDG